MSTPEEIAQSIDERLLEAAEEIRQLQAARYALSGTAGPQAGRASAARAIRSARAAKASDATTQRSTTPVRARRRKATAITSDGIQAALQSAADGLSAADLAEQTGGERPRVLTLLRQLEASGQVRRSGERRTTRWHLITDEDRIAQRAAELAALS